MASEAFAGVGTKFQRWDGAAWQDIAEVNSIDGPGMTKDVLEVTSLDTDAGYNEFITGFAEGGTLTLDMNFTRETYELMKEDFESDEVRSYRIQLPDYDSEPSTFTIEGLVIELPITMTADDKVTADVVIQITGQVILDDGISWQTYWDTLFTGVPYVSSQNPLGEYLSRTIIKKGDTFLHFGEESTDNPVLWWISFRRSFDGLRFTSTSSPIFQPGNVGEFDEWGQADPSVLYEGPGNWKMWFDALNGSNVWDKLGYATSSDGLSWNKYGSVLERGAAGAWDDNLIHHPCVIKHNGIYYMYYSGVKAPSGVRYQIGLATSPDGITWTKEASNPIIPYGSAGEWDSSYVRPSNPVRIGNLWYMWYWGTNGTTHAIGLATSPDLVNWTKQGKVLEQGASASWVRLVEGTDGRDKIAQIYYVAREAPYGVGLAKATVRNNHTSIDNFEKDSVAYGDTVKGTTNAAYSANYIYGGRVTVAAPCTPNKIRLYLPAYQKPSSGKIRCALYANSENAPTDLIAVTEEKDWSDIYSNAWNDFEFLTPPALSAGDYWAATNSNATYRREKTAGGSANWFNKAQTYGDFPSTITSPSISAFSGHDVHLVEENPNNVFMVALASEPSNVYFNNIKGNKQTLKSAVNSEFDWYWADGMLYIYSGVEHPDIRYVITYE